MFWIFKLKAFLLRRLFNSVLKNIQTSLNFDENCRNLKFFGDLHFYMKKNMDDFEKEYSILYGSVLASKNKAESEEYNPWLKRLNKDLLERINELEQLENNKF